MNVSQKCQYALRAVFELAKRRGEGPTTVADIAKAQAIPAKFLELILGQLRQGGFTESRRGARGGYLLAAAPEVLAVGDIIRFVDGEFAPVKCIGGGAGSDCPLHGSCAFMDMWTRVRDAVTEVYDTTTFQNLIDAERSATEGYVAKYCI